MSDATGDRLGDVESAKEADALVDSHPSQVDDDAYCVGEEASNKNDVVWHGTQISADCLTRTAITGRVQTGS